MFTWVLLAGIVAFAGLGLLIVLGKKPLSEIYNLYGLPMGKSLLWCGLTALAGLVQVWAVWIVSRFITSVTFKMSDFMKEGVFIFFSSAIIAAVTIDYHSKRSRLAPWEKFATIFAPLVLLMLCALIYGSALSRPSAEFVLENYVELQSELLVAAALYAFFIKAMDLR